jgi:hypothetical protein
LRRGSNWANGVSRPEDEQHRGRDRTSPQSVGANKRHFQVDRELTDEQGGCGEAVRSLVHRGHRLRGGSPVSCRRNSHSDHAFHPDEHQQQPQPSGTPTAETGGTPHQRGQLFDE